MKKNIIKLSLVVVLATSTLFGAMDSGVNIDTSGLKSASVASDVDAQLEKIYDGVKEFHIFKPMYRRWDDTDTFTTLVTGQNGFPVFSPRSDKDPKFTDYPIDYSTNRISRYKPVRPPESVKSSYTADDLGNKDTATYNAPIVSAGTIGKGRVLLMGSHLYGSILVNPRNYSENFRNNNSDIIDSIDMENFFHNIMGWLTEQNPNESMRYSKTGDSIPVLSNKERTMFWATGGWSYQTDSDPFVLHDNFNTTSGDNPRLIPTWREAQDNGQLDSTVYPMVIMEDFKRVSSWTHYHKSTERKTQLDEVELLIEYVRAGGGLLIMDSPSFAGEEGVLKTASNEIMKKAGVTTFFANHKANVKLLPNKNKVGGVHKYDMCLLDYIGHTDLQRRLDMDDYSSIPTTLQDLKNRLILSSDISFLEELLKRRERKIFKEGNNTNPTLTQSDCGTVEVELEDGSKSAVQTRLVQGDGVVQDGGGADKYAKYPVDLNFVQAQGDVGGSMNTLLAHELAPKEIETLKTQLNTTTDNDLKANIQNKIYDKENEILSKVNLNREYTNMSALLLNDAVFTGDKFQSLNDLLVEYKTGGRFVNASGEFYPGFSFTLKDKLDFRRKPVTRVMVERAFYDKTLKYDPSEFPGQTTATSGDESATIYLKRNTTHQKWYAGNMQSTGLYAPAHTDITVTLPAEADESKMQLQIGVGDNVGGIFRHEINLKRPPKYVKKYKFLDGGNPTKTITVQHPYGGLIFLKSFDNSKAEDATATVNFTGVQKAVRFVLGETTQSEWDTLRASATAPKAELESKHHIITVPKANMASLSFDDVTRIAQEYDQEAVNAYDFYGYDRVCSDSYNEHTPPSCDNDKKLAHKNREVFDPHISIGAGHSGYPVMVMNWKPNKTTFPQDATSSFLLWHEMGHNMVESWLGIPGATEVANNVMAGHQQKRFGLAQASTANVNIILAKGQPWADGGNSGRLMMFNQLAGWIDVNFMSEFKTNNSKYYESNGSVKTAYPFLDGDGFDVYKILHREARDSATESDKYDVCMKSNRGSNTKTDMLAICTSVILELDTKSFFEAWKAGVVGIGNVGGENIYDGAGGISSELSTGSYSAPSPTIQSFTVATPSTPTLTTTPARTDTDSTSVEVHGTEGNRVYVNGIEVGTIGIDGTLTVELDTSGGNGTKSFEIMIHNSSGGISRVLTVTIERVTVNIDEAMAIRFLNKATFGSTKEDIEYLMNNGIEAWIDNQLAFPLDDNQYLIKMIEVAKKMAPDDNNYTVEEYLADNDKIFNINVASFHSPRYRMSAWFDIALTAQDQLRQKITYALSQIIVESDFEPIFKRRADALATYYDILHRNAFGTYKDLLTEISFSSGMGMFLTFNGSKKEYLNEANITVYPDENYGREVMQLFSIGLVKLNMDGTAILDGSGNPTPTYTQNDVNEISRVFTGWDLKKNTHWHSDPNRAFGRVGFKQGDLTQPMEFTALFHDSGEKSILGSTVSAGLSGENDIKRVMEILMSNSSTAPFISKHLIMRLAKSNPTPSYVSRIATVFQNSGGDLKATSKAILLDTELWDDIKEKEVVKFKEPLIAYTSFLRAFNVEAFPSWYFCGHGKPNDTASNCQVVENSFLFNDTRDFLNQGAGLAPTVFNFYDNSFVPNSPVFKSPTKSVAPEIQIQSDSVFIKLSNEINNNLLEWEKNYILNNSWRDRSGSGGDNKRYDTIEAYIADSPSRRYNGIYYVGANKMFLDVSVELDVMEMVIDGDTNGDFVNLEHYQVSEYTDDELAVDTLVEHLNQKLTGGLLSAEQTTIIADNLKAKVFNKYSRGDNSNPTDETVRNKKRQLLQGVIFPAIRAVVTSSVFMTE